MTSFRPPQKKKTKHDLFGMGDNILFGCQWLPYPEPKALIMLQAKICHMFPYQSDGFHVKIYQTTRLPWFLRSLEVQMLISGNLFGRCLSELKNHPKSMESMSQTTGKTRPCLPKTNPVESKSIQKTLKIHLLSHFKFDFIWKATIHQGIE